MIKRERFLWIGLTSILLFLLIFPFERIKAFSKDAEKFLQVFHEVISYMESDYVDSFEERKIFIGAIRGALNSLNDPPTRFLDENEFKELQDETRGAFGGLGVEVTYSDGSILIVAPIDDTPAKRAGLMPQDRIIEINGTPTKNMTMTDAIKIMRGEVGTNVTIKIKRPTEKDPFTLTLTRELIQMHYVKTEFMEKERIGYLRLSQFMGAENTTKEFKEAMDNFMKKNAKGLIIDLRMNPGGLLNLAIDFSDLFLPKDVDIVSVKGRGGKLLKVFKTTDNPNKILDIPIVVMIDEGSASASEILAGALKDHKRAVILGKQSFGKGSVQNIYSLSHKTGLALTVQKYFTPSGESIHKKGIKPDVVVLPMNPSSDEKTVLEKITKEDLVASFVKKNQGYNKKNSKLFQEYLAQKKYKLSDKIAKFILKRENNLGKKSPVYDVEFDPQLEKAIEVLTKSK